MTVPTDQAARSSLASVHNGFIDHDADRLPPAYKQFLLFLTTLIMESGGISDMMWQVSDMKYTPMPPIYHLTNLKTALLMTVMVTVAHFVSGVIHVVHWLDQSTCDEVSKTLKLDLQMDS